MVKSSGIFYSTPALNDIIHYTSRLQCCTMAPSCMTCGIFVMGDGDDGFLGHAFGASKLIKSHQTGVFANEGTILVTVSK